MKWNYRKAERLFKRRYLIRALIVAQGNAAVAAQVSGLNRTFFHTALKRYGVDRTKIQSRDVYRLKPYAEAVMDYQRKTIRRILERANWSAVEASRISGINRTHFYRLVPTLGLQWPRVLDARKGNAAWRALDARPPSRDPREVSRPPPSR